MRRRVYCWKCGHAARRSGPRTTHPVRGRLGSVRGYGDCGRRWHPGTQQPGWWEVCHEPMLRRPAAAFVARAAWASRNLPIVGASEYDT